MNANEEKLIVGVDLGATKIRSVVATPKGRVLATEQRETPHESGPDAVIEQVAQSAEAVLKEADLSVAEVLGVGVGAPGPIDVPKGIIVSSPNMSGWDNVPLRDALRQRLGASVYIGNDVNATALAEHRYGAGRGVQFMLYVAVGSGIGGGIIVDGKLFEGVHGAAGEIGHMVLLPDGPMCGCGVRGHLEALSSGRAIEREAREALVAGRPSILRELVGNDPEEVTTALVTEAARQGDDLSLEIIARAAYYLGLGITSLVHICDPELVAFGGGVMKAGDLVFGPVREALRRGGVAPMAEVRIVPTELGDDAGALGAVALVLQAHNL